MWLIWRLDCVYHFICLFFSIPFCFVCYLYVYFGFSFFFLDRISFRFRWFFSRIPFDSSIFCFLVFFFCFGSIQFSIKRLYQRRHNQQACAVDSINLLNDFQSFFFSVVSFITNGMSMVFFYGTNCFILFAHLVAFWQD